MNRPKAYSSILLVLTPLLINLFVSKKALRTKKSHTPTLPVPAKYGLVDGKNMTRACAQSTISTASPLIPSAAGNR